MDGLEQPQIDSFIINVKEVEKVFLKKLKVSKASGPDDLPAYILNELTAEFTVKLAAIYTHNILQDSLLY